MIRIRFNNVSKTYRLIVTGGIKNFLFTFIKQIKDYKKKEFTALDNVTFEVFDGEIVGIIGRTGAGKSTTLGLMAGVLSPTEGEVEVFGKVAPLLELGAGFHHDLTGRENIVVNGLLLGLSKKEILEKTQAVLFDTNAQ